MSLLGRVAVKVTKEKKKKKKNIDWAAQAETAKKNTKANAKKAHKVSSSHPKATPKTTSSSSSRKGKYVSSALVKSAQTKSASTMKQHTAYTARKERERINRNRQNVKTLESTIGRKFKDGQEIKPTIYTGDPENYSTYRAVSSVVDKNADKTVYDAKTGTSKGVSLKEYYHDPRHKKEAIKERNKIENFVNKHPVLAGAGDAYSSTVNRGVDDYKEIFKDIKGVRDINTEKYDKSTGAKVARMVGVASQYVAPTGIASKVMGNVTTKAAVKAGVKATSKKLSKEGAKNFAKRRAAEVAADTPLDVVHAKHDSKGDKGEFAKQMGLNFGLNVGVGGGTEGIGKALKSLKAKSVTKKTAKNMKATSKAVKSALESLESRAKEQGVKQKPKAVKGKSVKNKTVKEVTMKNTKTGKTITGKPRNKEEMRLMLRAVSQGADSADDIKVTTRNVDEISTPQAKKPKTEQPKGKATKSGKIESKVPDLTEAERKKYQKEYDDLLNYRERVLNDIKTGKKGTSTYDIDPEKEIGLIDDKISEFIDGVKAEKASQKANKDVNNKIREIMRSDSQYKDFDEYLTLKERQDKLIERIDSVDNVDPNVEKELDEIGERITALNNKHSGYIEDHIRNATDKIRREHGETLKKTLDDSMNNYAKNAEATSPQAKETVETAEQTTKNIGEGTTSSPRAKKAKAGETPTAKNEPETPTTKTTKAETPEQPKGEPTEIDKQWEAKGKEYGTYEKASTPKQTSKGVKIRKTIDTAMSDEIGKEGIVKDAEVQQNLKRDVLAEEVGFRSKSQKEALDTARGSVDKDPNFVEQQFAKSRVANDDTVAQGIALYEHYVRVGAKDKAADVIEEVSAKLTEAARGINAAKLFMRITPAGRVRVVERLAQTLEKKYAKQLDGKKLVIPEDVKDALISAKTEKGLLRAKKSAQIALYNQIPATFIEKFNAMRYLSMLGNPRTHIRNLIGNAGFVIPREAKNVIAAGLENIAQNKGWIKAGKSERTKAILNYAKKDDRELYNFGRKNFDENSDIIRGNTYRWDDNTARPHEARHFGEEGKGTPVKIKGKTYYMSPSNFLEVLRKFNGDMLDKEDVWFMRPAYAEQMAMYMKANNLKPSDMVDDVLLKAQEVATNEALRATYRDMSEFAAWISRAKKIDPNASKLRKAGAMAVEGLIPFAKTPVNILRRGLEYSPLGLAQGIGKLRKAVKSGDGVAVAKAIDRLAAGMTGTGIAGLGLLLAKMGIITTEAGKDNEGNFKKGTGEQDYAIKIGGGSYTLDWFAPISLPFFTGAQIYAQSDTLKSDPISAGLDAIKKSMTPIAEMSMLQGVTDTLQSIANYSSQGAGETLVDTVTNLATNYFTQVVPTAFGQAARTVDKYQRSTTSTDESPSMRQAKRTVKKIVAKVPFLSKTLEPRLDQWGNPVINGETKGGRIIQNFFSPGYWKDNKATAVDKEILRLGEKLGDDEKSKVFPKALSGYSLTFNKEPVKLKPADVTKYNETVGKRSYEAAESLMNSPTWDKMSDTEKANALDKAYEQAREEAKQDTLISMGKDKFEVRTEKWGAQAKKDAKKYAKKHDIDDIVNANREIERLGFKTTKGKDTNIKALILSESGKANKDLDEFYGIDNHTRKVINDYKAAGGSVEELKTTQQNLNLVAKRVGKESVEELPAGAKALALAMSGGASRLFKMYDTSTPNSRFYWQKEVNSAKGLVASGEDIKDRQKIYEKCKNENGSVTIASAKKYLDTRKDLTQKQKSWYLDQFVSWNTKQNPYGHYTAPKYKPKATTTETSNGVLDNIRKNFPAGIKSSAPKQQGEIDYNSKYVKNEINNLGKNLAQNKLDIGRALSNAAKASKKGLTTPYNDEDYIPKRTLQVVRTGNPELDKIVRDALAKGGNRYLSEKMKKAPRVKTPEYEEDTSDSGSSSGGGRRGYRRKGRKGRKSGGRVVGGGGATPTKAPTSKAPKTSGTSSSVKSLKGKYYDWTPKKISTKAGWTNAQIRKVFNSLIAAGLTERQAVSRIASLWNTRFK